MGAYGLFSVVLLALSSKAPAYCEASTYVPLQLCVQLTLNMLTGMFIWKDHKRMKYVAPYMADFALALLSVYLAADNVDLFAGVQRWKVMRLPPKKSRFGRAVLRLLGAWQEEEGPTTEHDVCDALRDFLDAGLSRGLFNAESICGLVLEMQRQLGAPGASVPIVQWMEDNKLFHTYMETNVEFYDAVRHSLSEDQRTRLRNKSFDFFEKSSLLDTTTYSSSSDSDSHA